MAKWQTRQLEGLVPARAWRFESSLRQTRKTPVDFSVNGSFFFARGICFEASGFTMRKVLVALALVGASSVPLGVFVAVNAQGEAKSQPSTPKLERKTAQPWTGSPLEFEYANRDQTLKIPQVFRALKIGKGSHVADVGAGGGWLSTRLARQVGPKGVVYAEEILPRYVEFLQQRARREKLPQMKTVLGTTSDPKLPHNLDAVMILNAYHEFDEPLEMLGKIKSSMKPGARLGFIERDDLELRAEAELAYRQTGKIKRRVTERDDGNPITDDHRLALPIVEREAAEVGFKKVSSMQLGEDKYLLVVEKVR